jgi:hypothetical protein
MLASRLILYTKMQIRWHCPTLNDEIGGLPVYGGPVDWYLVPKPRSLSGQPDVSARSYDWREIIQFDGPRTHDCKADDAVLAKLAERDGDIMDHFGHYHGLILTGRNELFCSHSYERIGIFDYSDVHGRGDPFERSGCEEIVLY